MGLPISFKALILEKKRRTFQLKWLFLSHSLLVKQTRISIPRSVKKALYSLGSVDTNPLFAFCSGRRRFFYSSALSSSLWCVQRREKSGPVWSVRRNAFCVPWVVPLNARNRPGISPPTRCGSEMLQQQQHMKCSNSSNNSHIIHQQGNYEGGPKTHVQYFC